MSVGKKERKNVLYRNKEEQRTRDKRMKKETGRWDHGGQVVSVLALYSDDRVRIPLKPTVFSVDFFCLKRTQINKKETGNGHF